jgi:hypothetical protein
METIFPSKPGNRRWYRDQRGIKAAFPSRRTLMSVFDVSVSTVVFE